MDLIIQAERSEGRRTKRILAWGEVGKGLDARMRDFTSQAMVWKDQWLSRGKSGSSCGGPALSQPHALLPITFPNLLPPHTSNANLLNHWTGPPRKRAHLPVPEWSPGQYCSVVRAGGDTWLTRQGWTLHCGQSAPCYTRWQGSDQEAVMSSDHDAVWTKLPGFSFSSEQSDPL